MVNVFVISAKMDFLDWMPIMGWDVLIANVILVVQIFLQVKEQFVIKIQVSAYYSVPLVLCNEKFSTATVA